jgi:hypothetical protein
MIVAAWLSQHECHSMTVCEKKLGSKLFYRSALSH